MSRDKINVNIVLLFKRPILLFIRLRWKVNMYSNRWKAPMKLINSSFLIVGIHAKLWSKAPVKAFSIIHIYSPYGEERISRTNLDYDA